VRGGGGGGVMKIKLVAQMNRIERNAVDKLEILSFPCEFEYDKNVTFG
jgi:hypothetical protein